MKFFGIISRLKSIDIVKVFSLNAISTLIRMLSGMISVKIVAAIIGPSGIALLGQLNNLASIILGFANGGINNGVTKYVAEYHDSEDKVKLYVSNALRITVACSIFISLLLIAGNQFLSRYILLSEDYGYVFIIFGFTLILYSLNGLLISILNGFKHFKTYVIVNISGTVFGLIFSLILVLNWGLTGALINAVTFQSIMFFVTLWLLRNETWLKLEYFLQAYSNRITKDYLKFSAMTLVSLALLPLSQMFLRGYVISQISIDEAGWWEGINRISNMYLSVITTSLSVYYLPRLSEISDKYELRCEILKCIKFVAPMLLGCTSVIFILRHFIVWLLFSSDFFPMEDLFLWQLIGDILKILSWLISFQMVAKAQAKIFLSTEIIFTFSYLMFSFIFMRWNGIVGLTQGYLINYLLYFSSMLFLYRKVLFIKK